MVPLITGSSNPVCFPKSRIYRKQKTAPLISLIKLSRLVNAQSIYSHQPTGPSTGLGAKVEKYSPKTSNETEIVSISDNPYMNYTT